MIYTHVYSVGKGESIIGRVRLLGSVPNFSTRNKYTRRYDSTHISRTKQDSWSEVALAGTDINWCCSLGPCSVQAAHSISCVLESHNTSTAVSSPPDVSITTGFILPWLALLLWVAESGLSVSTWSVETCPTSMAVCNYIAVPSCNSLCFYVATEEYQAIENVTIFRKRNINERLIRFL